MFVGKILFIRNRKDVQKSRQNIRRAFPDRFSDQEIDRLILRTYSGRVLDHMFINPPRKIVSSVKIKRLDRLENALSKGVGAILWEPGMFGYRDLMKNCLKKHGFHLAQLQSIIHFTDSFSIFSQKVIRRTLTALQYRYLSQLIIIPRSGSLAYVRKSFDHLEKNGVLSMNGRGPESLTWQYGDFLGEKHRFSDGPFYLSQKSGAAVIPAFCFWSPGSGHYQIVFEEPLQISADSIHQEAVSHCVALLQKYVETYPDQFWDWNRSVPEVNEYQRKVALFRDLR